MYPLLEAAPRDDRLVDAPREALGPIHPNASPSRGSASRQTLEEPAEAGLDAATPTPRPRRTALLGVLSSRRRRERPRAARRPRRRSPSRPPSTSSRNSSRGPSLSEASERRESGRRRTEASHPRPDGGRESDDESALSVDARGAASTPTEDRRLSRRPREPRQRRQDAPDTLARPLPLPRPPALSRRPHGAESARSSDTPERPDPRRTASSRGGEVSLTNRGGGPVG